MNPRVVPEDRKAVADLQYALQDWKRYIPAKRREAELLFKIRKGSLASVQGRVGDEGGTKAVDRAPEPDRAVVNEDVRVRVGSPDALLEVYIVNFGWVVARAYVEALSERRPRTPEMPLFSQLKKAVESASKNATTNPANP